MKEGNLARLGLDSTPELRVYPSDVDSPRLYGHSGLYPTIRDIEAEGRFYREVVPGDLFRVLCVSLYEYCMCRLYFLP